MKLLLKWSLNFFHGCITVCWIIPLFIYNLGNIDNHPQLAEANNNIRSIFFSVQYRLYVKVSLSLLLILASLSNSHCSNVLGKCVPFARCVSVDLLVTNGTSSPARAEQKPTVSLSRPSAPALVGLQCFKGLQCATSGCSKFALGRISHAHMKGLSENPLLVK